MPENEMNQDNDDNKVSMKESCNTFENDGTRTNNILNSEKHPMPTDIKSMLDESEKDDNKMTYDGNHSEKTEVFYDTLSDPCTKIIEPEITDYEDSTTDYRSCLKRWVFRPSKKVMSHWEYYHNRQMPEKGIPTLSYYSRLALVKLDDNRDEDVLYYGLSRHRYMNPTTAEIDKDKINTLRVLLYKELQTKLELNESANPIIDGLALKLGSTHFSRSMEGTNVYGKYDNTTRNNMINPILIIILSLIMAMVPHIFRSILIACGISTSVVNTIMITLSVMIPICIGLVIVYIVRSLPEEILEGLFNA